MKAESGKTYAQIQNGRCHWIFTQADLPEWNANQIQTIDVTGNVPAVGDVWNGSSFTPYVPPPPTQAQINAAANAAIQKLSIAALPDVIEIVAKLASGADKTKLTAIDTAIKAEKAKKA